MMITRRFSDLPEYAFPRLRALLERHSPGGEPLAMSIGEPRHPMPALMHEALARHSGDYAKYPPIDGTPGFRAAVGDWITQRYGLSGDAIDPDRMVLPLNGTREGLFMAAMALAPAEKNGQRAAVLIPNPFYQCYAAAALAVGAEPVFVPATAESGWLPDYASLPEDLLARTVFAYYCSPSNPQGAVASREQLGGIAALAENYDFIVGFDECYSEIYPDTPPSGGIAAALAEGVSLDHVLSFNSLSKRSNAPGLRSGFVAGGAAPVAAMTRLRSYAGAPSPLPVIHAAQAMWSDETHVEENRALYRQKFRLVDEILGGKPGYMAPKGGFFLWLEVGDGEAAALKLWCDHGVRVLPGAYLGRGDARFIGGANPGTRFIRAALVEDADTLRPGLEAIAHTLDTMAVSEAGA